MLINIRLITILAMGFSSGLPIALIGSTLQAWFTEANMNLVLIGTLTLVGLPYALKFLWAPLLDFSPLPFLDRRRGWILICQLMLALLLAVMASFNPYQHAHILVMLALSIAFVSATQDISIDAYRTEVLTAKEWGMGAAFYVFAWRMASLVSGGVALILAHYWGWKMTYEFMSSLLIASSVMTVIAPKVAFHLPLRVRPFYLTLVEPLLDLLKRDNLLLILGFIICYKLGDAFALSLMSNFLLHGLGFSLIEVGFAYKSVSIFGAILGALIGGIILTKRNLFSALLLFGMLQACSTLLFVGLALVGKNFSLMVFAIFIENFCSGLSTAAFMAFLASLCNTYYTATQYALLSAVASLGRIFLGPLAGMIVQQLGWIEFFLIAFTLTIPGLIILSLLKSEVTAHAAIATQ